MSNQVVSIVLLYLSPTQVVVHLTFSDGEAVGGVVEIGDRRTRVNVRLRRAGT